VRVDKRLGVLKGRNAVGSNRCKHECIVSVKVCMWSDYWLDVGKRRSELIGLGAPMVQEKGWVSMSKVHWVLRGGGG
jgi:hypothetical protein